MMALYIDPAYPRYSRRELVDDAKAHGLDFSVAALRDWQAKGLHPDPVEDHRRAQGRPGSEPGLWSETDRLCLIELLHLRDHTHTGGAPLTGRARNDVVRLANFVVWRWLHLDGVVALPQAKKALRTWARSQVGRRGGAGGLRSEDRLRKDARRTMRLLASPEVPLRSCLEAAERLVTLYWRGDPADVEALTASLRAALDPGDSGRPIGPSHQKMTAEQMVKVFVAPFHGAAAVAWGTREALTDADWDYARAIGRQAWANYQHEWHRHGLVADPIFGYEPPTPELQVRSASWRPGSFQRKSNVLVGRRSVR